MIDTENTVETKVEDLKEGDFIDLESDDRLSGDPLAAFEFCEIVDVVQVAPRIVALGFDSIGGLFEYTHGTTLRKQVR